MTELDKKLDEILGKPSIDMSTEIREAWGKAHQRLKSLLKEVCEEVIGKDEKYEGVRMCWAIEHRNNLRAEQLEKLNKILRG